MTNPLIYNPLHFDQYSRIAIRLKKNSVFGEKFENEFEIWKKFY